jgi:hypothetical protein
VATREVARAPVPEGRRSDNDGRLYCMT